MLFMNRKMVIPFFLCLAGSVPNVLVCSARQASGAQPTVIEAAPSADEIISRLEARNREQDAALRKFEGTRIYRMRYKGFFGSRDAEMVVSVQGSPEEKQFTIESQSGSRFIIDHIFKKLLDGEQEAATDENRQRTALSADNYDFSLASVDTSSARPEYVLNVIPRTDEKFLYRGKIWVDAKDFAVTRIEAEPAKSPSVWIKKTQINHTYEKLGDFWLPAENQTDSAIRLGGHAVLSIEYKDYKITGTAPLNFGIGPSDSVRTGISGP
jgi:hypothetical protein